MRKLYAMFAGGGILAAFCIISAIGTFTAGADAVQMRSFTIHGCTSPRGWDPRYYRKQVDAIVSPGVNVTSAHSHDFCGSLNDIRSNANSTTDWPIVATHENDPGYHAPGYSNMLTYADWGLFWTPTAFIAGQPLPTSLLTETWQSPVGTHVATPPFAGLYVVGNSHATDDTGQPAQIVFTCGVPGGPSSPKPMDCTNVPGGRVTGQATFPDCWDGTTTPAAPAGIMPSHFAYSTNGVCPPGMVPCAQGTSLPGLPQTRIAQLVVGWSWLKADGSGPLVNPLNPDGSVALTFSSGPYQSFHMDWIDHDNLFLNEFVDNCLNNGPCAPRATINGDQMDRFADASSGVPLG